jgi:hypothetical protein
MVFSQKHRAIAASRWRENELILRHLYELADGLAGAVPGAELDESSHDSLAHSAERDFYTVLSRLNMVDVVSSHEATIQGGPVQIRRLRVTGSVPTAIPETLEFRSEREERFLARFDELTRKLMRLARFRLLAGRRAARGAPALRQTLAQLAELGFDLRESMAGAIGVEQGLTTATPPQSFTRDELDDASAELDRVEEAISVNGHGVIATALLQEIPGLRAVNPTFGEAFFASRGLDEFFQKVVGGPNSALTTADGEYELLVLPEVDPSYVKDHEAALRNNAATHRVLVVNGSDDDFPRRPRGLRTLELGRSEASLFARNARWAIDWLSRRPGT